MFGAVGLLVMHLLSRAAGCETIRRADARCCSVGSFFLLVAVLGARHRGQRRQRWIGAGSVQIQPSELAKVALILYGADLLARKPKRVRALEGHDALPARRRRRLRC